MGSCGTHVYSCQISWSWWSQNSGNGQKTHVLDFQAFFEYFLWKNSNKNWGRYPKFCLKKRLNLENLYAKFGKAHWSCLGIPAPNSPGCPKIQNFETFFCQLWKVFLAFWVIVPSWNFGIRLVHFMWISKFIFEKLASLFLNSYWKMSKNPKLHIFEKIQNQISPKLLNPSFWNFACEFMWGTCLFMPNFMILMVIKQPIWQKKPNFGFFERFLSIFWKKTVLKIEPGIQNLAWRSAWTLRTCMPNLVKLSQVVWP